VRVLVLAFGAALLAQAPLQCSHDPGSELRREETPPEALYDLATRFKAKGDVRAYRDTLSYLAERYPSSRFATRARDELAARGDGGAE
jgi:outer membrane protein assembly factor BamD (BamD/ComL family)